VSFEELKALAASKSLIPQVDMVWGPTMDDWKPAGQVEGLFAHRSGPPKLRESLAPPTDPFGTRQQWDVRTQPSRAAQVSGTDRWTFLLVSLIFPFAWKFSLGALTPFLVKQFGASLMGTLQPIAAFVPVGVLVYLVIRRLSNLGMSRWWSLAILVPILNLWVGFRCVACPAGYAYHKKLDPLGIVLVTLYSLIVLAALFAVFFGANSTELQEQIRQAIRWPLRVLG